ncbi:MAG: lamin tail domain-containing protein, partial [Candidatus Vogelbacteria bacterium]|nr:lamin tail domain-containing protein [Candidatus Vogelbacteria bacterium]
MRQYYSLLAIMVILVLILPSVIQANGYCTRGGYTVATINGIFTDERGARENMDELKKINGESRNNQPIDYEYLLNPSHGAGIGDLADVVVQKMFENQKDSDYDIEEMISTASEKVQTQKLLLVAHSQGNFYANDFYDSVVKSGTGGDIPAKSLGIYAVATPADRVAGGGAWLTSDTDKVIVGLIGNFPGNTIMKPNTHIELSKDDDVLGHSFSNIYLKYRGPEIVDGIHSALDKLQNNDIQDEAKPCISTPPNTLAHRLRGATLAVTDPIASVSSAVVMGTISGVYNASVFAIDTTKDFAVNLVNVTVAVVHSGYNGLATAAESLGNILGGTQNQSSSVYAVTQKAVSQEPPHITKTPIQIKAQSSPVRLPAKEVISSKVNNIEVVGSAVVLPAQLVAAANLPVSISENTIILTAPSNIVINSKVSPAEVPVTQQAPVTDSGASVFISTSTPESHTLSEDAGQVEAVAPLPDVILPTAISDLSINVSSISNIVATSTLAPPPPPDTTLPDAPQITSPDVLATVSAFSNIVFSGTAQAGSGVYVNINGGGDNQASTTAALDGSWSMDLNLSDGLKHLDFYAVDSSGNTSSSTSRDITVDTIPPIVTLSVLECQNSLSSGSCLTLSPTLNVSWSANEDNIDHYVISKNGVTTSTYSTSTTVTAMNDSSYTFSVYAVDQAGNKSATVNQVMYVSTMPVIINELAWGGTPNHPDDEWVELYNRSSQDINLSGFILYSKTDMTPYINLTGTVRSGAYFLVEAKNTGETDVTTQAPIKNVTPDMWTSFGTRMLNTGENMLLSYASSTVDQIPYCLNWCGVPSSRTTERYDPDSSGNSSSNWS